jgi:hypothetical protein
MAFLKVLVLGIFRMSGVVDLSAWNVLEKIYVSSLPLQTQLSSSVQPARIVVRSQKCSPE